MVTAHFSTVSLRIFIQCFVAVYHNLLYLLQTLSEEQRISFKANQKQPKKRKQTKIEVDLVVSTENENGEEVRWAA